FHFSLCILPPPTSTLFPYTTLFRSSIVGPVDILVNNAGITRDSVFKRMTEQDWMAVINTNLNSVFNVTRQVIDGMSERGWGRIIDRKSTRLNSSHLGISYAVFCLKK